MLCRLLSALVVLLAFGAALVASEIKGKIVKVDPGSRKITMTVEDKEQEFTLSKDTRILGPKGDLKDGLKHKVFQNDKALKRGIPATVKTEKQNEREVVVEVKLGSGKKKTSQE
jgi:hypothetical protein